LLEDWINDYPVVACTLESFQLLIVHVGGVLVMRLFIHGLVPAYDSVRNAPPRIRIGLHIPIGNFPQGTRHFDNELLQGGAGVSSLLRGSRLQVRWSLRPMTAITTIRWSRLRPPFQSHPSFLSQASMVMAPRIRRHFPR